MYHVIPELLLSSTVEIHYPVLPELSVLKGQRIWSNMALSEHKDWGHSGSQQDISQDQNKYWLCSWIVKFNLASFTDCFLKAFLFAHTHWILNRDIVLLWKVVRKQKQMLQHTQGKHPVNHQPCRYDWEWKRKYGGKYETISSFHSLFTWNTTWFSSFSTV